MNAAIIQITDQIILDWLDFHGGHIMHIEGSYEHGACIRVTITHPDLPDVGPGESLQVVTPLYTRTEDSTGHFIVERSDPPKL